jgi:hypothetical protein
MAKLTAAIMETISELDPKNASCHSQSPNGQLIWNRGECYAMANPDCVACEFQVRFD